MQIVIDIDEKDYKDFQLQEVMLNPAEPSQRAKLAIANGKPLPKGHGDLKDADELLRYIDAMPSVLHGDGWRFIRRIRLTEYIQDSLPTIIEADKEVDE